MVNILDVCACMHCLTIWLALLTCWSKSHLILLLVSSNLYLFLKIEKEILLELLKIISFTLNPNLFLDWKCSVGDDSSSGRVNGHIAGHLHCAQSAMTRPAEESMDTSPGTSIVPSRRPDKVHSRRWLVQLPADAEHLHWFYSPLEDSSYLERLPPSN